MRKIFKTIGTPRTRGRKEFKSRPRSSFNRNSIATTVAAPELLGSDLNPRPVDAVLFVPDLGPARFHQSDASPPSNPSGNMPEERRIQEYRRLSLLAHRRPDADRRVHDEIRGDDGPVDPRKRNSGAGHLRRVLCGFMDARSPGRIIVGREASLRTDSASPAVRKPRQLLAEHEVFSAVFANLAFYLLCGVMFLFAENTILGIPRPLHVLQARVVRPVGGAGAVVAFFLGQEVHVGAAG